MQHRNNSYYIQKVLYLSLMAKAVSKYALAREEDYWLFPVVALNILFGAIAIYASVLTYRAPALILFCFGLWFTSGKIRKGYTQTRARVCIVSTIILSLLLALFIYELTN